MSQVQKIDFAEYAKAVKAEIEDVIPSAKVEIINQSTIQIDNNGIISAVKVREVQRKGSSVDVKVTNGGDRYDDKGAKVVGEGWASNDGKKAVITIKEKAIKEIVSQSSDWDIKFISAGVSDKFNDWRDVGAKEHPSIEYSYPYNADGKVGIQVRVDVPNAEQWESNKKDNETKFTIPSGKVVMKIISESEADFSIDERGSFYVQGTVEQVNKVVDRIVGNPLSDW
jgi:hypothetical protein